MTIHKEGRSLLIILFVALLAINLIIDFLMPGAYALHNIVLGITIVIYLLILQFFRSPFFNVDRNEKHVLAPADGKVVVIEETDEPEYLKSRRKQVSIFMSPLNVHVNRTPVAGSVSYFKYHPGDYLVAWDPKSSTKNERTTIAVKTSKGTEILFRQIAGALARRIKCYISTGQSVDQGQEFGFIKFGSRVDVFLPLDAEVMVKVGDAARGGRTIIAKLS